MIHENSSASYEDIQPELAGRHKLVFEAFPAFDIALTDRQVKEKLGLPDMNSVRPRITELIRSGTLREVGSVKCPTTKKTVRVVSRNYEQ